MLGFSVYLNQSISQATNHYLVAMKNAGFTGVFTSLQIPEEDASKYIERIHGLAKLCQQNNLRLTADVSAQALQRIGLDVHDVKKIKHLGLTALRLDDGFPMQIIAGLSQAMPIALNASTITAADVQKLRTAKANFDHLEAWHNYYPRPETGLDQQWVLNKNQWLHAQGFKTMAFVSGDANLRGPLNRGLPTLENDRGRHPLAAAIDLLNNTAVDHVYIGDPDLSKMTQQQFYSYFVEQTLLLPLTTDRIGLFNQTWHNRADVARDVVRLKEGRLRQLKPIVAQENSVRDVGTVTEDNQNYGRYMGELQIVKRSLPASNQVNVIGRLEKKACDLLPIIGSNQAIQFVKNYEEEKQQEEAMLNLNQLTTETRNAKTMHLDTMSTHDVLQLMNQEDQTVAVAVSKKLPQIESAVKEIVNSFQQGGRLFYMGAGTSGRLGVLDAAECVPTFGTEPEMVQGLIAGGMDAMTVAVEGAEDSANLGKQDLKDHQLSTKDTVVGIAASGRTPYVIGALDYAQKVGAATVSLACNTPAEISQHAQTAIEVEVGPEVLTGSTRLKSGTAQKLVLNMLSTVSMIGIGKVYKNLMVDVKPTNEKLIERSKRIIMQATDCNADTAAKTFLAADKNVKLAIVMILTGMSKDEATKRLTTAKGFVRKAIN